MGCVKKKTVKNFINKLKENKETKSKEKIKKYNCKKGKLKKEC